MIEHEHRRVVLERANHELFDLALADEVLRIEIGPTLTDHIEHLHAGRARELFELVNAHVGLFGRHATRLDLHEHRAIFARVDHARVRSGRGELFLERFDEAQKVEVAPARNFGRRHVRQHAPLLVLRVRRQEVRNRERPDGAVRRHHDRRDEIEPQLREVDEIVARDWLRFEVRVHEPDATQTPHRRAQTADVGQVELFLIADDHVHDVAAAIDEHADLALDLV